MLLFDAFNDLSAAIGVAIERILRGAAITHLRIQRTTILSVVEVKCEGTGDLTQVVGGVGGDASRWSTGSKLRAVVDLEAGDVIRVLFTTFDVSIDAVEGTSMLECLTSED